MARDKGSKRQQKLADATSGRNGAAGKPCPTCGGDGWITRDHLEQDEDGGFDGSGTWRCERCKGSGTIDN